MKLYYCATYYQLLFGIVYCQKNNCSDETVFAVDEFLCKNGNVIENIKKEKLVKDVISLPFIAVKENSMEYVLGEAEMRLAKASLDPAEFDEIIVAATHAWFGIYLASKEYKFTMVEECCGILSKIEKLRENVALTSKLQDEYAEELGLYCGNTENIVRIICSDINSDEVLNQEKVEVFNLVEEMTKLNKEQLGILKDVFCGQYMEEGAEVGVLLLTQHFANLGILEWEEQKDIYRILMDYFVNENEKVFVKSHPADIMDYQDFLPECIHLRERVPSEFLPFVFKKLPRTIMTVSSTAVDGIGSLFKESYIFDFWFEQWFDLTHNYYCAIEQMREYLNSGYQVLAYGVNKCLLNNLLKAGGYGAAKVNYTTDLSDIEGISGNAVVFIDDFSMTESTETEEKTADYTEWVKRLSMDTICVYLNSKFMYTYCGRETVDAVSSFIPVVVWYEQEGKAEKHGRYYCFSKGEMNDMVEARKQLKYENAIVFTEVFQGDELKIKVLEGMLRSTEERLKFYLEEEE